MAPVVTMTPVALRSTTLAVLPPVTTPDRPTPPASITRKTSQAAKAPEAPGKDRTRPKGMEKAKAMPEVTNTPPMPRNRPPPAPPLGSRFAPFIAHTGGHPLSSFSFVFYRPEHPNSLAPFCTAQRPFCGARFREDTNHGRRKIDVESANTSRWRSMHGRKP